MKPRSGILRHEPFENEEPPIRAILLLFSLSQTRTIDCERETVGQPPTADFDDLTVVTK
jgi:hypothetical protein